MAHPICPECSTNYVKRVRREGRAEWFLSLFYIYPFCCRLCSRRFRSFQRGVTYVRIDEDQQMYEPLPVTFPATFANDNANGNGQVADISMSGCTIHVARELAPGTVCRLSLQITQDRPAIRIDAAVVRNVNQNRVEFKFLRIEKAAREQLRLFMHTLLFSQSIIEGKPFDTVAEYKTVNWTL